MSIRRDHRGKWVADVCIRFPDGKVERKVRTSPVQTKRGATSFEHQLRQAMLDGAIHQKEVQGPTPKFKDFAAEFMEIRAPKTSGPREMEAKKTILNCHLIPRFGKRRLDAIGVRDIDRMQVEIRDMPRAPKTVNNITTVLKTILLYAKEVEILAKVPKITLLPVPHQECDFLDFDEYAVMLEAVRKDPSLYLAALLGADAGLRAGEIAGLKRQDINFKLNRLKVLRQQQQGQELPPKWNSVREVPLTERLARALKAHRHLQGPWVLVTGKTVRGKINNGPWTKEVLRYRGERLYSLASLPKPKKVWHCLRHTFCSHLAMKGAPPRAIQELAGHKSITTTMKYMHLSPPALVEAIALLDRTPNHAYMAHTEERAKK